MVDSKVADVTVARKSRQSGIYAVRCHGNGKVYVGSAKHLERRWEQHRRQLRAGTHAAKYMQHSWAKYGEQAFSFEVLEVVETLDHPKALTDREQVWIEALQATNSEFGFNKRVVAHSNMGMRWSAETKAKMSISRKGKKRSAEARANLRVSNKVNWVERRRLAEERGYFVTDEARANMSKAQVGIRKGRKMSPEEYQRHLVAMAKRRGSKLSAETRAKISEAGKGRTMSEANKAAHIARHTGATRGEETRARIGAKSTGRRHTDETKAKCGAASRGLKRSRDSVERSAAARTGAKRSPETCAKMKAAWTNRKANPEALANMRAGAQRRYAKKRQTTPQLTLWPD